MASTTTTFSTDPTLLWIFSLPAILPCDNLPKDLVFWTFTIIIIFISLGLSTWALFSPGGPAWKNGRNEMGLLPIPGPSGWPIFGSLLTLSRGLAHRTLAILARVEGAKRLMAFSLGSTPVVVTSDPDMAREILTSPHFADRPIKYSAKQLMFSRAIGFAPNGTYWRLLRKIASTHLFAPKRILAHEGVRMEECNIMINTIAKEHALHGVVSLRKHLQGAALNNIMGSVFGKRYDFVGENISEEAKELHEVVKQGFELLGAFNWCDHLPWLNYFYDPSNIVKRCSELVPRVHRLVRKIIDEHRHNRRSNSSDGADFVDVLLSLDGDEKLEKDDMIAVLWEMIFRGTDTIALLIEWIIAELVLNPKVQSNLQLEIDTALSTGATNSMISKLPYLQAVVKETLRVHPPGPLLSWARLSSDHVHLSNGMVIPKGTTTMVNMWAITHDSEVWDEPLMFKPGRFIQIDVDVRGGDLRLAPFGSGRRVCPGKDLGLTTVSQWVAMLVHNFEFVQDVANPVDLSEVLKLSCEMKKPLSVVVVPRK